MLKKFSMLLVLFAGFSTSAMGRWAEEESPFAGAKEGDWVRYKVSSTAIPDQKITLKKTVIARSADSVTIRSETTVGEAKGKTSEQKISLKEKFDPSVPAKGKDGKATLVSETAESISVKDKKIDCKVLDYRIENSAGLKGSSKIWMGKGFSLGMVKMEANNGKFSMKIEVEDFGGK
ncbi:hypothetical protein KIH39_23695 [Telmatocola sphagniphila]|uniref:Uncharacterized protein n=1 Tax=Telmatocola sphagniphila TaxID=1123043 RepID=A0A8E6ET21_9BACT|nr:hypothetical protein [Telmatocola sphagniphila]QVL31804.1 hypothetical protein KIH39_23695 [Telmatocola sphagniphila]